MDPNTLEWLKIILTFIGGLITGGTTIAVAAMKQNEERKKEAAAQAEKSKTEEAIRAKELKEQWRLYTNPFVLATEALQSRLYNILERNGLYPLRTKQPDGSYAEDTLYLIARYFGWESCLERHGSYADNPEFRKLVEKVRTNFTTDRYGQGVFCIFRPQQEELGQLIMKRVPDVPEAEYETLSVSQFKEHLKSPPFNEANYLVDTLSALKVARNAEELKGRARLIDVQNCLVDLLEFIEGREAFTVFEGKRKKAQAI